MFGHDAFDGVSTLVVHLFHSAADRLLDVGPDETVAWALDLITPAVGAPCPDPIVAAVTGWDRDPYSLGAYSHIPPGTSPADVDLLGRPLHGRLLFAGEHTRRTRLVYTDGAMSSGIREAKRLSDRPV